MTDKQKLWHQYYAAIKAGRRTEARQLLSLIHNAPSSPPRRPGGCSKCRKRM